MRRFLPGAKYLAPILGSVAMLLRMWMLLGGTDDRGLYPRAHPAWVLLCLLTPAVAGFFFLLCRYADARRPYRANFPPSLAGACGHLAAAMGVAVTGLLEWTGPLLGILSFLTALALALGGWCRLRGKKPSFYVHMLPCLYFILRIFATGRILGAEPEMSRYLFRFLANLACLMAGYHLWGFDVGLGNRRKSLFWSLTAGFLCLAATPGSPDSLLQATMGLWLLTNLCDLTPRRLRRRPIRPTLPAPEAMTAEELIAWAAKDPEN